MQLDLFLRSGRRFVPHLKGSFSSEKRYGEFHVFKLLFENKISCGVFVQFILLSCEHSMPLSLAEYSCKTSQVLILIRRYKKKKKKLSPFLHLVKNLISAAEKGEKQSLVTSMHVV